MASRTVIGLAALSKQLEAIGRAAGTRALRNATTRATTPVLRAMRARAPVGSQPHRTYKGRLVAPGFGRRSIAKRTRFSRSRGTVSVEIGVRSEAYYLIQFYDQGPHRITQRKYSVGGRKRRVTRQIKPYVLKRRPWFVSTFVQYRGRMERYLRRFLRQNIEKAKRAT